MSLKVLLVSKLEKNIAAMRQHIQDEGIVVIGESGGGADALEKVENQNPDMVLISMTQGDLDALNLAERIITYRPKNFVVLIAEELNMETMQAAMNIGAHNVTVLPKSAKEFAEYIKGIYNSESLRIRSFADRQNIAWSSQVLTVFSAKGGIGKTTVAVNLAMALAERGKKVAIVDLDLQFGDVPVFLDLEPKETIAELMQDAYAPNIDTIRSYMVMHSGGVHVLCAPKSPEYAEMIPAERVQALLTLMRSYYDFVIIDTASVFNDVTMTAMELSNTIYFVVGQDVSILKNARLAMNLLESLQQKEKVQVLVNHTSDSKGISLEDVEKVLHAPVHLTLPGEQIIAVNALNKGIPLVTGAAKSKLAAAIQELAGQLTEDEGSGPKKKRGSNRLFGKKKKQEWETK
ncbi:MAG: AAA family ATPase [Lachnospiraceae bacterium]